MQINQGHPCLANGQVQIFFNLGYSHIVLDGCAAHSEETTPIRVISHTRMTNRIQPASLVHHNESILKPSYLCDPTIL
ncbi:MAG: hypothetical protein KF734_10685 [Saprospiraceae bacterium]|nr:hypothetical protein [Saprospiraceae bacterium]